MLPLTLTSGRRPNIEMSHFIAITFNLLFGCLKISETKKLTTGFIYKTICLFGQAVLPESAKSNQILENPKISTSKHL